MFRAMRFRNDSPKADRQAATTRHVVPVKNDWPLATWNTSHRVSTIEIPRSGLATGALLRLYPLNERANPKSEERDRGRKNHGDDDVATHVIQKAD